MSTTLPNNTSIFLQIHIQIATTMSLYTNAHVSMYNHKPYRQSSHVFYNRSLRRFLQIVLMVTTVDQNKMWIIMIGLAWRSSLRADCVIWLCRTFTLLATVKQSTWHQAIAQTNRVALLIRPSGTNRIAILVTKRQFLFVEFENGVCKNLALLSGFNVLICYLTIEDIQPVRPLVANDVFIFIQTSTRFVLLFHWSLIWHKIIPNEAYLKLIITYRVGDNHLP